MLHLHLQEELLWLHGAPGAPSICLLKRTCSAATRDDVSLLTCVCTGLLKWVLAMVNYYNVAKGVEPKRKKVAEAEKNLRLAQKDLAQTKDQLAALNSQLAELRTQFANKTTEQQVR